MPVQNIIRIPIQAMSGHFMVTQAPMSGGRICVNLLMLLKHGLEWRFMVEKKTIYQEYAINMPGANKSTVLAA